MATVKQIVGSPTDITPTNFSSLSAGWYSQASTVCNNTTNNPVDLIVNLAAYANGTPAGNKQAVLFAKASLDNVNWTSGPENTSSVTDEADLVFIGVLPIASTSVAYSKMFNVAPAFGGALPPYIKFIVKNDSGAGFGGSAPKVTYSEVSVTVA